MSPFVRSSELRSAASVSLFRRGKVLLWGGESCRCIYTAMRRESETVIDAHWLEIERKLAPDPHVPGQLPFYYSSLFCFFPTFPGLSFQLLPWGRSLSGQLCFLRNTCHASYNPPMHYSEIVSQALISLFFILYCALATNMLCQHSKSLHLTIM